jgi:hypothetical protein
METDGTKKKGGHPQMDARTCEYCRNLLPADARSDQRFCSRSHKTAARKQRRKREKIRASLVTAGLPLGSQASEPDAHGRHMETDARIHAILAADEAGRAPQEQAREWAAYARRHGTIHPDELAARQARGRQARAEDWQQGTARFQPNRPATLADAGRRARAQQVRPMSGYAPAGPAHWDDDDPQQPGQTIDGGNFRSGRGHWGRS